MVGGGALLPVARFGAGIFGIIYGYARANKLETKETKLRKEYIMKKNVASASGHAHGDAHGHH